MGAFQAMPGVIVTTSSVMKCCDGNCVRRWPLTSFAIRTHLYLYDKGKGVCVRDVCAIYDNNISPSLLMIIIKIIILYFIQIRHTDAFPPTGTLLVRVICKKLSKPITSDRYDSNSRLGFSFRVLVRVRVMLGLGVWVRVDFRVRAGVGVRIRVNLTLT